MVNYRTGDLLFTKLNYHANANPISMYVKYRWKMSFAYFTLWPYTIIIIPLKIINNLLSSCHNRHYPHYLNHHQLIHLHYLHHYQKHQYSHYYRYRLHFHFLMVFTITIIIVILIIIAMNSTEIYIFINTFALLLLLSSLT